jgi:hypothetical protein
MPAVLPYISEVTVQERLVLRPETVDLAAVLAIYRSLSTDALADGHENLAAEGRDAADAVVQVMTCSQPRGLVDSNSLLLQVDRLIEAGELLRSETASAYDRYDKHTKLATEALELLIAYRVLLEEGDFDLRVGLTPHALA